MPEIKLWFSPGACSFAPHILLREIGASFEAVKTSIPEGAHLTEEFTRLNPKNRVPVLLLDGEVITELPAIATAISNLAPDRWLMGQTDLDKVRAYEWMNWLSGTVHGQGFGGLWRPHRFSDDPATFEIIKNKARRTIADCFDAIDKRLSGMYSTGQNFTAVDAFLLVFYRWGNGIGIDMASAYPQYAFFAEALLPRPSVAAAIAAEGINPHGRR
jgi:glutathione S-transferase